MPSELSHSHHDLDVVTGFLGPFRGIPQIDFAGYSDDGGIVFENQSQTKSSTAGNTSHVAVSTNNDKRVMATITVWQDTRTCARLFEMARLHDRVREVRNCPFFMRNPISGDQISSTVGIIMDIPPPTQEGEQTSREFPILLPKGRDNIQLASKRLLT